jgi:hypothetical protein
MKPILPKSVLRRVMYRFLKDKNREISIAMFADLAGVSESIIKEVFLYQNLPLSEFVQRRVSKAYTEWKDGQIAIMQNRDNTKFYEYRKEARPALKKESKLQLVNGQFTIKMGIANRYDYFDQTLDEQFERG